jgi:hypothetical protein
MEAAPDTPDSVPDSGHTDAVPAEHPDADAIIEEALGEGEPKASTEGQEDATPELDVEGADSTEIEDPVLAALNADERFKGHTWKTREEALKGLAEARSAVGRVDHERALGREVAGHWDEYQAFRAARQTPAKQEDEVPPAFAPPEMPVGIADELAKPVDQRDPEKIEAYNKRARYIHDKWQGWMEDPLTMMGDLVLPHVDDLIQERFRQQEANAEARTLVESKKEFIDEHVDEIARLQRENPQTALSVLIELTELRHKAKGTKAAEAKSADAAALEAAEPGPTHVERPDKIGKEDEGPPDGASIMREVLRTQGTPVN